MTEPVYRSISEAEYPRFAHISGQAFNFTPDLTTTAERLATFRGLFVDDMLVAQLGMLALRMQTGAGDVPCLGLGGVATPPEQRRRGYVGALLRAVCDEVRASGTSLCLLHPFKESFYRRFGWATALERRVYAGAPALLSRFRDEGGSFVRVGSEDTAEIDRIYSEGLRGRWGPFVRSSADWQRIIGSSQGSRYSYVWRDATGAGRAYLIYSLERTPDGLRMGCREAIALDPMARRQLFVFMANHDSQCFEVRFPAPADAPVNLLMPDPLRCEVQPWSMLRVIDVCGALSGYPARSNIAGRCVVAVRDGWLDHNNGTFALEVADGAVTCAPSTDAADITIDVAVLAQLLTRYLRPRTAAAFGLFDVHSRPALALLEQLFTGLAPYNTDDF